MNNSTVPFVSDYKNHILISRYISLYSYPVIMIVGTIANILTVLVMTRNRMRNHSTYFYLRTLAVADQMVTNRKIELLKMNSSEQSLTVCERSSFNNVYMNERSL